MALHILFFIIQAVSLLTMLLFIHEYRRISHEHQELILAIEHGKTPSCKRQSEVICWIYIIATIVLLLLTTLLYFSIPALFS